jgi:hypothetical protein
VDYNVSEEIAASIFGWRLTLWTGIYNATSMSLVLCVPSAAYGTTYVFTPAYTLPRVFTSDTSKPSALYREDKSEETVAHGPICERCSKHDCAYKKRLSFPNW